MAIFTIVLGFNWEGLYVDDKLIDQTHDITSIRALDIAKEHGPVDEFNILEADMEWLDERGSLPDNLSDVKFEG